MTERIRLRLQWNRGLGVAGVRVVKAGRTRPIRGFAQGVLVAPEALRDAVAQGLFDGAPLFFQHQLEDGRDLRDMAGVLAASRYDEEAGAVHADLHPYSNAAGQELAALVDDFRRHAEQGIPAPDVGVSLDGYFSVDRAATPPRALRLLELHSVDLVFRPAAGGRILAVRTPPATGGGAGGDAVGLKTRPTSAAAPSAHAAPSPIVGRVSNPPPADAARTQPAAAPSAHAAIVRAGLKPAPTPSAPTPPAHLGIYNDLNDLNEGGMTMNVERNDEQSRWREQATAATLAAAGLPEPVQRRLAAAHYETPGALNAAIDAARAELAQLAAGQVIQIGGVAPRGGQQIGGLTTGLDYMAQAMDWLFGLRDAPTPEPALRSARALYQTLTGDYEFHGRFQGERVTLQGANTDSLPALAANAMNKVIVQQFSALSFWRWYEQIAYPTPNDGSVQAMQWTVLGGIANLPAVEESASYEELTVGDAGEVSDFVKHGGYVPITLELLRNSDIQRLQAIPRALALAAVRTRSASVAAIFTDGAGYGPMLAQDNAPLFDEAHGNVATTPLGTNTTAWRAARLECFKQTELTSEKALGLFPRYWLGSIDLYDQALALFGYGDGQPTSYVPEAQARGIHDPRPIPLAVPDFSGADWAYIVDPQIFPVVHISYAQAPGGGVHPAPELFTVASPTAGMMFTNDVLPIKVRDWFAVGVNGYRGVGKRIVG